MFNPTKILVPTDFSEYSDKALAQALDIAKQYNAKVYLLHVIHEAIHQCVVDYCLTEEQMEQIRTQMTEGTRESMQKQMARFPMAKDVEVITDVKTGIPYEATLEEAKEKGIDLIVIGSLGRSGIAKYIIGSVARNVLKGAKCPVLLTK
jgi:nucleotide-binding universal stress UspA family protein